MTITLELSPEQEARLAAQAKAAGINNPADYIRALIDAGSSPPAVADAQLPNAPLSGYVPRTGAEILDYWDRNDLTGHFFMDGPDSPELARELRRQAETRSWHTDNAQQGEL